MPLNARWHVRKMRGGAQSSLVQADDGQFYVVKFRNNPQHRRILINEAIASVLLRYLQIAAPEVVIVSVSEDFLAANPGINIQLGATQVRAEPGWHFGSRYPGDPAQVTVYDFLPDVLLKDVVNLRELAGMLVFDKWVANADGRQAVFFRSRISEWTAARTATRPGFLAWMIDHGFAFNGPHWEFPDAPLQGLYHRPLVYENVRSLRDFEPWLERIVNFPETVMDEAYRKVPLQWIEQEEEALADLLEALYRRRSKVAGLIEECQRARPAMFPRWT